MGITRIRQPGVEGVEPELGYRLVSSTWAKGYATEGARALIDHGSRRMGCSELSPRR